MTTQWDGQGLPPAAQQRLSRAQDTQVATSMLSVPSAASIESVGLRAVGEVMGCAVYRFARNWYGFCGYGGGFGGGFGGGYAAANALPAVPQYQAATRAAWGLALSRLQAEAEALGAHGVVGAARTVKSFDGNDREFVLIGTAVRFTGATKAPLSAPFIAEQSGTDTAKLLLAGWLPLLPIMGLSVMIRHDDMRTRSQMGVFSGNTEVSGFTDLVTSARDEARTDLHRSAKSVHAQGVLLTSQESRTFEVEPSDGHRDHVMEQTYFGTALGACPEHLIPQTNNPLDFLPIPMLPVS